MSLLLSGLRKNFKRIKAQLHKLYSILSPKQKSALVVLLLIIWWLLLSYIFYRRFPSNYNNPNFYAEDGWVFADNIIDRGFLSAVFTPFNGYFVSGLYVLTAFGQAINHIFFGGDFVQLARSFAIISYLFLGFMAALPLVLFRRYLPIISLILLSLFITFVPLREYDYAILGTLGNLKFAFIYLGFVLLVYRHLMPNVSKKVFLVDLGILICAYTNITVYAFMPFALLRYTPYFKNMTVKWRSLLIDRSFISLFMLGVALLPQLIYVKLHGIPELVGYLDGPFNIHRGVEIFVSRSYIYPFIYPANALMNDVLVIIITALVFTFLLWFAKRARTITIFGLIAIAIGTGLFVIKRTGVSDLFYGYKNSGPDQFFYAQNWIFYFVVLFAASEIFKKSKRYVCVTAILLATVVLIITIPKAGSYGSQDFMQNSVGNIYLNAKEACLRTNSGTVDLDIYPSAPLVYKDIPYDMLCTDSVINYEPPEIALGLSPYGNNYLANLGGTNSFTQTFKSPQDNLSGVSIYLSTFLEKVKSPYSFVLYDKTCKNPLREVSLNIGKIKDNSFYKIMFKDIVNSKDSIYCFSLSASEDPASPLAVQLSKPDIYLDGDAFINGVKSNKDIVFKILYE